MNQLSSYTFRNFIRRLNNAAVRRKYRDEQLSEIGERMKTLGKVSAEKKPSKKKIDKEVESLNLKIREVVEAGKFMRVKQRNEDSEIDELKRKIALLEEKFEGLGHIHSIVTDAHNERIAKLQKALVIPDKTPEEEIQKFILEKVKPLEEAKKKKAVKLKALEKAREAKKVKAQKKIAKPKKVHHMVIKSLKKQISDAEKIHKKLEKAGHPKEHLDRLRKVIDSHKDKLSKLK